MNSTLGSVVPLAMFYINVSSLQLIKLVVHLCIVVDDGPDDFVFGELLWKPTNLLLEDSISSEFSVSSVFAASSISNLKSSS